LKQGTATGWDSLQPPQPARPQAAAEVVSDSAPNASRAVRAPTTAAGPPAAGPAGFAATAVAPNGLAPDGFAAPTAIATQPGVTPAGVATEGIAPDGFVESQLAGLSAIIRLAEPAATTAQHAAIALQPPPPGPPPTLPGWAAVTQARPRPAPRSLRQLPGLPLIVILTVQVVTSFRLIKSNSAFSDEALYLWAGRLEWSHWLHHTPVPPFQTYFSGSPVVYPPIGALAASVGGLTGARLLSLLFLLGATILLHGLTKRIFDRRSAHFAAALFAGLGSAQFLGAFATYDAFAILGLATATWLGIRSAGNRKLRYRLLLLIAAAIALAVADAAKYTATLFDPVVIVVIVCFHWHALGRRAAIISGATVTFVLAGGVAAALVAGGASYWTGITSTTLTRTHGNWPVFGILYASAGWTGPVLVLAIFGAMATSYATRSGAARTLAWTLVAAGLLAPAEDSGLHQPVQACRLRLLVRRAGGRLRADRLYPGDPGGQDHPGRASLPHRRDRLQPARRPAGGQSLRQLEQRQPGNANPQRNPGRESWPATDR
jgi:Dolichyl-phosphate-mannose-protein mannosyltransferase